MARHYLREGATLEDIRQDVRREFGDRARITRAERVIKGGLAGFFGRPHYEATVLVEDSVTDPVVFSPAARIGIAALLDEAEADDVVVGAPAAEEMPVSTATSRFEDLLSEVAAPADPPPPPPLPVPAPPAATPPAPVSGTGDLLLVVGPEPDVAAAARFLAHRAGPATPVVVHGGEAEPAAARRQALGLRADGVRTGVPTILTDAPRAGENLERLRALGADQVWLAVDASRKPEDTTRWVATVRGAVPVVGVVALNAAMTSSPETVEQLGLPVIWSPNP